MANVWKKAITILAGNLNTVYLVPPVLKYSVSLVHICSVLCTFIPPFNLSNGQGRRCLASTAKWIAIGAICLSIGYSIVQFTGQ